MLSKFEEDLTGGKILSGSSSMANLDHLKIYTFARITRTEKPYAVHKLQQHEGDLNAAIDAHYRFADTTNIYVPDSAYNLIDMDVQEDTFPIDCVEVPESLLCDIDDSEEEIEEEDDQSSVDEGNESTDVPAASQTDASALDEWLALYEEAMIAEIPESRSGSLTPRTPSPLAEAKRLIRKKHVCRLEIQATRKMKAEQEIEKQLAEKEASLPLEPAIDEENVVTILIRMPNGNRLTRCFMKSHNLQAVFDFIDISRLVKPNTYRLVKPFPRVTFGAEESYLTLHELGLINKQEALFLDMI